MCVRSLALGSLLALLWGCADARSPIHPQPSAGSGGGAAAAPSRQDPVPPAQAHGGSGAPGMKLPDAAVAGSEKPNAADAAASDGSAPSIDAAAPASDAQSPDANTVGCSVDAGAATDCEAHLCSFEGQAILALRDEGHWTIGGLDWNASICERSLGWPAAVTSDTQYILFALTPQDRSEIEAGAPVLVYWGNPGAPPAGARACSFEAMTPLPECPATPTPPTHPSLRGCRGPMDPGCATCKVPGTTDSFRRASAPGVDWYNVWANDPADGSCGVDCPLCASCTYRDEETIRDSHPARPECEPCPADTGLDPCSYPAGCACWCDTHAQLKEACPSLLP